MAAYLLTNCFTITMAVFDVAQHVVSQSAGIINGNLDVTASLADLQTQLEAMGVWELIGLWLETNIINLCMWILSIVIFVIAPLVITWQWQKKTGSPAVKLRRS